MNNQLTDAEINHLRRLLGWVRCEIGQAPDEMVETVKGIAPAVGDVSDEGKQRLIEAYAKAASVPAYVRQAVKMLEKTVVSKSGEVVDAEPGDDQISLPLTAIGMGK